MVRFHLVVSHRWHRLTECFRFTGPKVNIEHMMLGREGNLIDGTVQPIKDNGSSGGSTGGDEAVKVASNTNEVDRKNGDIV